MHRIRAKSLKRAEVQFVAKNTLEVFRNLKQNEDLLGNSSFMGTISIEEFK